MLKSLLVKNYAVIADLEIEFQGGLTTLTGETGAGKSVLLGALGTILGDRVDTTMLRTGADKAIIEGVFEISHLPVLQDYLHGQDLEVSGELLIRREISDSGRSRAFVNDTPVQLSVLQDVGELLVDLHGQHDHQSLLKVQNHLSFIDHFGDLDELVSQVEAAFKEMQRHLTELRRLENAQSAVTEKQEFLLFQLKEIEKVNPHPEEEQELLQEEKIFLNSQRLFDRSQELSGILYDEPNSIVEQFARVQNGLQELARIDEAFVSHQDELNSARLVIEEMVKFLQDYNARIESNPERLEEIQNRIAELTGLKKKYGRDISALLEYRGQIKQELSEFEDLAGRIQICKDDVLTQKQTFKALCQALSGRRRQLANELEKLIPDVLVTLGMPGSRFNVMLKYQDDPAGPIEIDSRSVRATASGMDFAEFFVSLNAGEDLRPLAKVASGGEISRVMLALKSVLAQEGQIPVLIFDEIDNGVSGRVASAVGRKLRELAAFHQVLCITHLPQIASMGHQHLFVEKQEVNGRTETTIRPLSKAEREQAVARLLAGESISEAHLNSARELLQDAIVEH